MPGLLKRPQLPPLSASAKGSRSTSSATSCGQRRDRAGRGSVNGSGEGGLGGGVYESKLSSFKDVKVLKTKVTSL